ncbi:MAG TPA: methyltransferase domain-containing protein [Caulobacteraceae bacterium]|jgi:SAM-dependent methyltransferase|nr:methyltransferase domain-containing protein [Caulobacteraceae bacterium]
MTERLDYYSPQGLSAAFYDVVAHFDPTLKGEVDFYAGLVPAGSWVLELGCGTGRITLPLAERGYAVVGLDLAANMLARAEAKRAKAAADVAARTGFVLGDMTAFNLNNAFDAVIAPFFGFSHLPRGGPRRKAMAMIARHLKPGGVAALHAIHPDGVSAPAPANPGKTVLDVAYDDEGRRLKLYVAAQSYDPAAGRFEQQLDYVQTDSAGTEQRRSAERLTYYSSNLEADARGTGLVLEDKITPFNTVGEMWVFRRK